MRECCKAGLPFGIAGGRIHQDPDAPHAVALLRARGDRPSCRRAAEERDELAPGAHSITSSARARIDGEFSRPSALAALRLINKSYLVGFCTGRSPGLSPL